MLLEVLVFLLSWGYAVGSNPSYAFSVGRSSGQLCGASLFHDDLLLTAASCYGEFAEGILMGGDALDGSDGSFFGVDVEIPHPDFVPGHTEYNLMVVKLKSAATNFTEQALNGDDNLPRDGADLVVHGFSRRVDETGLPELSNDVAAKKIDHAACGEKYSGAHDVHIVDDKMFCSSTVNVDECHGNVGDPVLDGHGAQVGIVAGGSDCDTQNFPTLNVRVGASKAFLRAAVCQLSNYPPGACGEVHTTSALAPGIPSYEASGTSQTTKPLQIDQSTPSYAPVYYSFQPSAIGSEQPTVVSSEAVGSAAPSEETQADAALLETNTTTPGTNKAYAFSAGKASGIICGASLVHEDLLLTAASCYGVFAEGVLMGGSWLDGSDSHFFAVDREVKHPSYVPGFADNNLMIVKLESPATNYPIQLLNTDQQMPLDGSTLLINGFSRHEKEKGLPAITNDVMARKIDHSSCTATYEISSGQQIADEKLFCSSTYDPRRCHGNMGDPVINAQGTQVGIVAGGSECNTATYPTLNVRVSASATFFRAAVCQLSNFPPESCTTGILTSTADTPIESKSSTKTTDSSTNMDNGPRPSIAPAGASSIQPSSLGSSSLHPSYASPTSNTPSFTVSSSYIPTVLASMSFSTVVDDEEFVVEGGYTNDDPEEFFEEGYTNDDSEEYTVEEGYSNNDDSEDDVVEEGYANDDSEEFVVEEGYTNDDSEEFVVEEAHPNDNSEEIVGEEGHRDADDSEEIVVQQDYTNDDDSEDFVTEEGSANVDSEEVVVEEGYLNDDNSEEIVAVEGYANDDAEAFDAEEGYTHVDSEEIVVEEGYANDDSEQFVVAEEYANVDTEESVSEGFDEHARRQLILGSPSIPTLQTTPGLRGSRVDHNNRPH